MSHFNEVPRAVGFIDRRRTVQPGAGAGEEGGHFMGAEFQFYKTECSVDGQG